MKKISIDKHIQPPYIVSNIVYFKDFIVAIRLISQEIVLVNYTLNKKVGQIKLSHKAHQLGDLLCINNRLWTSWKSTIDSYAELGAPEVAADDALKETK